MFASLCIDDHFMSSYGVCFKVTHLHLHTRVIKHSHTAVCTCHRVHTQLHAHSRTRPGVGSWVHTLLVAGIRLLVLCCTHYWEHREPQDVCWNCIAYTIGLAGRLVDGVRLFVFLDCGVSILSLSLFLSFFLSLSLSLGCGIALLSFLCVASGVVCCVASCCFLCGIRCLSLPCVTSSFFVFRVWRQVCGVKLCVLCCVVSSLFRL